MNAWLIVLNCDSEDAEVVSEHIDFQAAVDECNRLVELCNRDYSVFLKEEWESEDDI